MTEEWRPVSGWVGLYEVSDAGRVRRASTQRVRVLSADRDGYRVLTLHDGSRHATVKVHALVCRAWHGRRPPGAQTRHRDGDPENNTPANVCWGTGSENTVDQIEHGRHRNARKTHCDRGHEFTEESTLVDANGARQCRICRRAREAADRAAGRRT